MFANKLGDLDDFLTPSLECIKPNIGTTTGEAAILDLNDDSAAAASLSLVTSQAPIEKPRPNLIKAGTDKIAQISLTDCLACSGCVTSAETVLIQQHSNEEFLKLFDDPANQVVVAISQQSISSMAQFSGPETDDFTMFKKLQRVFRDLGATMVLEMSTFSAISLELAYQEFKERFTRVSEAKIQAYLAQSNGQAPEEEKKEAAVPTTTAAKFYKKAQEMPIIASECPGWVCYAEKRVGDLALPFMSKTKSPQQICGTLAKLHLAKKQLQQTQQIDLTKLKVVCVMPCYDKKLEAVRPDFTLIAGQPVCKEVDTVLATHELLDLFNDKGIDISAVEPWPLPDPTADSQMSPSPEAANLQKVIQMSQDSPAFRVQTLRGRTSNGYLEYIFRKTAKEVLKQEVPAEATLVYKQGKNRHYQEVTYGNLPMKFVAAYGFQHIQNIIRKLKTQRCDYEYVELMACPSGCVNGGGQIKPQQMPEPMDARALLDALELRLGSMDQRRVVSQQAEDQAVNDMIEAICGEYASNEKKWFETTFHPIDENDPMLQVTKSLKW